MEVGNVSFVAELDLSKAQAQLEEFRKQLNGIKVTSTSIGDFEKTIKKLNNQKITIKVNHNPLTDLNKHIDAKVAHVKKANTYFKNNPLKVETKIDELSYKELQSKVKALKEKGLTKIPLNAKKEVLRNELSKQSSVGNSGLNNCDCEGIKSELKAIRSILSVKLSKANNGITENAKNVRQLLATKSANPVSVTKQKESGLENTVKSLNQEIKQVIPEVISQLNSVIKTKQEPEKDTSQIEVLSRLSSIDNGIFHVFSSTEKLFGILKEQNKILEQKSEQKDEQKDSNINSEIKNGLSTINDSLVQILGTNKESNNALKSNNQIVTQIQTLLKQRHKEKEQLKSKTSKTQGMQPKEMPLGYQVALKAILGAFKGLDINEIEIPMLKEKDSSTTGRASYLASDNSISLNTEIYERLMKGEATKNDLKTLIHELVHAVTNGFKKTSGLDNNLKEKIKPNTPLNIPLSESAKKQASTFSGRYVAGQVYPQKQIVKVEDEFLAEAVALTLQDKVFEVFEFLSGKSNTPATLTQETELVQIIQLLSDIHNALLKTTEAEIISSKQVHVEKQKQLKRTSSISLSQSNSESLSLGREKKMTVNIDGENIDLLKLNPKFVDLVKQFTTAMNNPNIDFDAFSELSDRLVSLADDLNEWSDDGESLKHPYDYGILMEHIVEGAFVDQQGFDDNDDVSYSLDDTAIVDAINQSNIYLKGIRRTGDEIFDRLNKPIDVSETKGKTQATSQTKGMKPSEMPLGYQVALKAILSAFDLKIKDIAIPELVEMSKEDSKIAEGQYEPATNKIHLPKKDMDNLKNNNIDEFLMKTLIHELVHAVINNFRTGWEEYDLQSTMVGDFIQPRVVNIPLKEVAKQLSQDFLALYKDDPAYLEERMIGKTGEYNAEVVAMSLMVDAYALYEQMLDNPNYLGKDKNNFDSFAVKESYEVKVVKLLENIFNLLKTKFGIETKTENKQTSTTEKKEASNEAKAEDKPKTTRGRKPKGSTSPDVLPSLLDTDSLSLSLDDDTAIVDAINQSNNLLKEIRQICGEINLDILSKPTKVVPGNSGHLQEKESEHGMRPAQMPLAYQVALKAVLSAFNLKVKDISIPSLGTKISKDSYGNYDPSSNKINVSKDLMEQIKQNKITEHGIRVLIHELVHAVRNNFQKGKSDNDRIADYIDPITVNIPLSDKAKEYAQNKFVPLYQDEIAYQGSEMIGKTEEYAAETIARTLGPDAFGLYEQMAGKQTTPTNLLYDTFAVKESNEIQIIRILTDILNLLNTYLQQKGSNKNATLTTVSNEEQEKQNNKNKKNTFSFLGKEETLQQIPLIQSKLDSLNLDSLKKIITTLPIDLQAEIEEIETTFASLNEIEKNYNIVKKAFETYKSSSPEKESLSIDEFIKNPEWTDLIPIEDSIKLDDNLWADVDKYVENIIEGFDTIAILIQSVSEKASSFSKNVNLDEISTKQSQKEKQKKKQINSVLPSLDTSSLSLSLDDDTGIKELLKSPVLFYKEFMKRMPSIQKEFEKIDIKNLKKTIQKLPVEFKEELQDNLDDVKLSFNNLSSVEKNFKYIEKAFNNYEKSKNKNKKALKGFLGYSEIEAELKKVYAQLEQKQELDIDLDIEKEPLWETIQLLESLLEKSESLADITIDFPSMDAFIKDSGWVDWLSDADLSKIDEELVESFSGYAKGIIGEWETIIPAIDSIFKEITALSEKEGYEIQKNLSAGSPGLITDILDIWQRRGLSGLGEIFDRITVAAQESSNEMQSALGGFLEYFDFDIKRFAFDKITDGLREITVGAFNSALQVENLARQLTFSTGKSGTNELQRMKKEAQDLGINFIEAAEGYRQFSASTLGTSMNAMSGELVSKFQKSFAAYGLNREQQQGAFLALSQMASKGVVSMEELRQQLAERLPGALNSAASSMGLALPEFLKLVESGQVLAEDLLPKMAAQLEQDTSIALMESVKSTQSELTRLENNIFNIQAGLGQLQLTLAKLGLPILNAMLKTLADNMDWIAIVIGSLAISIGVKLVGSINALSMAFGTLWASLGPILPLALIISGIAVAVKGLHGTITAHTKEIKEYNNALKELATIEAKIRKDEKPTGDGKRYDRDFSFFGKDINENSWDAVADFLTQRSTRQANEFINDSKRANEALQSVTDSIINASKRTRDIDIGNGVTVGNDLSEDTITKVQDRLADLRTQSANLKFKIAVLADKGDLEKVKELQDELGEVNKEIGRVSTEPFKEVAVMEKRLKAVQALAEQFEMKKTEMELKGLDSRASQYNTWLEEARKLEAEINEQIEKRNEAIKEANDLYTKRIQTLRQLQRELAKINYMTQLEGIDNQITAIQRRTGGQTSEYQFDQEMRQARAIEVETKLKLSTEAFNIYENDVKAMLSNLDAGLKAQIATEIGVADLDKALMEKKVSPEVFAQLTGDMVSQEIKDLVEQSPDLKELIVKSQDYLTTWQDIKQQQLESANVVKEQFDATKQRKSDLRDFKRQLEDLDLSIADYFRQRARGLEDFETQYQDIAIQNQRQSRDLLEQYQDLGRTLNLQLLQAKNQLATLEKDIKRQSLTNQARQSLNFGADGLFSGFINLIDELMVSENEFDAQELTLNEQRLQTEEEVVNIARQVRSLQEQSYDAERQRIQQLRDLMRAQEDWIIQQKASWTAITHQVEDMERQAKEMGIAFTGIAEHLDGINGSYLKIHNAIADMAEKIQNSANNMSVGGTGGSGTPTGNVVTPVAGLNMNSNYQWGASRDYGTHWKVDYPMPNGTPVVSSIDGEITKLAYDKAGEAHIIVKNGDTEIILGHLRDVTVKLGDMVSAGQQLGTSGDGHLDYGVKHKSQWIHPNEFHKNPGQYLGPNYKANANTSSSSSSNTNTNNQNKGNNTQSLTQQNKPTTKQPEQDDLEMAKHLQKIRVARMAEARQELIDARKQLEAAKTNLASAQKNRKNIEPYVFAQFQEEVKRVEQLVYQKHKDFTYWEDAAINGQKEIEVILNRRNLINKLNSEPDKKPVKPTTDNQQQSKLQEEYNQLRKLEKPTPAQIKRRLELEKILKNNSLSSLPLNFSTPELNNFELNASLNPIIEPKKIEDQLGQMNFNLPMGLESTGFKDNLNFDVNKSIEVAQTIKLRDLMLEVGFPKDKISDFIGIFGAESTFNPNAHNYSDLTKDDSYGLGQVNLYGPLKARLQQFGLSRPEELYDIRTNLEAVLAIYHEAGNSFAPWAGTHGKGLHTKFMNADPTVNLANNTVNGVGSTVSTSGGNFNVPQIPRLPENTGNLSIGRKQLNEIITGFNPKGISDGIAPLTVTMDNSSVKLITDSLGRVIINSQNVDPIIATLKNNQQVTQEQMMNILYFKDQNDYPGLMNYLEQQNIEYAKHKDEILQRTREQYEQQRQAEQLENEKKAVESTRQALQAMRQQQEAVRSLQLQMMQFNETIYGYLTASEKANIIEKERENQFLSLIDQITNAREEIEKFVDFSQDPAKGKEALNNLLNKFKAMGNDVNTPELKAQIEEYLKAIDAGMSPLLASVEIVRLLQKELNNTEDAFKDTTERMKQFTKETSLLTDALSALQPLVDVFDKIDATVAIGLRKDIALMEIDKQFVEIEQALRNNVESLQRELEKTDLTEDERKFVEEQLKRSQDAINKLTPELKIKIKAKTILDIDFQNIADQISAVLDIRKKVAERAEKDNPFESARHQKEIRELEIIIDLQNQLKAIEDARIKFQNNPEILSKLDEYEKRVKQFADVDLSRIEQEVNVFAKAIKDPLNNAFKGLFSDFIRGTKTLKDLFLDFANSVADFFADLAAKMATQWVMDKLFPPKKEDDKDKKEGSAGWTWRAFEEVWGNYNGQGGNGNNNGITYSTLPLPKGFEIPQLQPMSTNIEDMTSNITYDILQSNPVGTMNINLPPQMQQGGSNILSGLFSGLLSGVTSGISSGFGSIFTGANPFSEGAGLAMPSSFVNPMNFLPVNNPLSFATDMTLPIFSKGGVIESAINSYLFGGVVSSFSKGGKVNDVDIYSVGGIANNIKSFSRGGNIVESASLGLSVMKAMQKEGSNAVPVVAHIGERLLSAKTGDAQIFNQMEKEGVWDEYKRNRFNPEVKSFNAGGIVGNGIKQFTRNYSNSNRVQNQSTIINVSTPDALSFRKSRSQLAQEEKLAQKRMERFK